MQEAEKKLDLLIARKSLDFQAIQQKSIHPHEYRPSTGVLRIFIYNTCENQPWQKQLLQQKGLPVPDPTLAESSWTLRIEGKFISDILMNNSKLMKHSSLAHFYQPSRLIYFQTKITRTFKSLNPTL